MHENENSAILNPCRDGTIKGINQGGAFNFEDCLLDVIKIYNFAKNVNRMKINSNYKLREIAGETIVVNQGSVGMDMTRIISLNDSARLLYEQLSGKEFTLEDAAKVLVDTYNIDMQQALTDAGKWVEALTTCKVIE